MKKKWNVVCIALVLVISTLFTACGHNKKNEEVKENVENKKDDKEITQGGSIIVGITNDLDSLDPHKAEAAGTREVLFNIFEGLVKLNSEGELVPAVASEYNVSEDGMTYTFTLRDGVKFHNGDEVTVDDVVYSLKRCAGLLEESDPKVRVVSALSIVSSIDVVDEKTVKLTLNEANTELLGSLTCAIIPKDYTQQETKPIGTGPFKAVSYEALHSFVIQKNDDYYGDAPYLDKVTFKVCADASSAFLELQAGNIDIFPYLTQAQASQLSKGYNIEVGNANVVQGLFLNNTSKPFDDIRVRQAMCYAIDRQAILDFVAGGKGTIIGSNMFANFTVYADDTLVNEYPYNVEKAKELLKDAGYESGFTFTITVPSNYQFHVDTAQVIVEQLKQVGITAQIQLVEWASWLDDVYRGRNFESTIIGLDGDLIPSEILTRYNSDSNKNFVNYSNPEFDRVFDLAVKTIDEDKKIEYYKELQAILAKDAASVYIQDPASLVAVNKKITGYQFYPVYVQDMSVIHYVDEAENH